MKRFKRPPKNSPQTLFIIGVGAAIMIVAHLLWWEVEDARRLQANQTYVPAVVMTDDGELQSEEFSEVYGPPESYNISKKLYVPALAPKAAAEKKPPVEIVRGTSQAWKDDAAAVNPVAIPEVRARVVIIIDDMGMGQGLSRKTIDLPAPLTLAFLPYAPNLKAMTAQAKAKGHELMIHMPMEPMNPDLDVGTIALLDEMSEDELNAQLDKAFASFDGYVGVNNHMGSRLTQNERAMHVVMNALAKRGLLFVDSKTISTSVAAKTAAAHGLDYAGRDVFLDHENTDAFVAKALAQLEAVALKKGVGIAIGHPKKVTINGLRKWMPTLAAKGIQVVPVSAVVRNDRQKPVQVSVKSAPKIAADVSVEPEATAKKVKLKSLVGPDAAVDRPAAKLTPLPVQ